jgi:hypothetical protein
MSYLKKSRPEAFLFSSKDEHPSPFVSITRPVVFPSPYPVIQVFVYTGRSHGLKARHSERSVLDPNQAKRQVQLSTAGIPCGVQISGSRAFGILKVARSIAPEKKARREHESLIFKGTGGS